ncbi:MAG: FHA domain-containing protein [Anaerolineaceae bacterium]|nr:FHA domain-containing protein [Anaerolineaceae bacterium]
MQADFALDYDVLTVERAQKVYLMARLVSGPPPEHQRRRPLNLSLVIDRSGSMAGEKIAYTRQAAQFLVQNLSAKDLLSVVVYHGGVEVLFQPEPMLNKDVIAHRIASITTGNMTNLSGGWLEGCNQVAQNLDQDRLNRVILMTDGLANRGITSQSQLVALAQQKYEGGISTTTMGLGDDFNEDLLVALADAGGGAFYFIESPEVAPLIFDEELRGLLSVVGQNLTVTINPTESVAQVRQMNAYPQQIIGRQVTFRMGDVFGDEVKTLVLELAIPALTTTGEHQIAVLRFEYDEITAEGTQHQIHEMPVIVNIALPGELPAPNTDVQESVLLLQAANARRAAISAADKGQYQEASGVLRAAAEAIEQTGLDNAQLVEEREALVKQADDMARGAERYDQYSRKTMHTQAIYTMTSRHEETQMLRTREVVREEQAKVESKPGVTPTVVSWNGQDFPLDGDLIRIGRAKQNEITLLASSISRFHAQLTRQGDTLLLEDLGSTNGTTLNGQRLDVPQPVSVGDTARLGYEHVIFKEA